jgi:Holliday junction resolvasome RuvABC endonuclease subunit
MRALAVIGLDPSLTSFGIARTNGPDCLPDLHRIKPRDRSKDEPLREFQHQRLAGLLREVETLARGADLAVVEGVLAGMPGAENHLNLAGLHWQVRHRLWEIHVPYAVITPSTRMKYLTGRGAGVEKTECALAAAKRFPMADITGTDTADALTLAQMGADAYGEPLVQMPADRTALLHARRVKNPRKGEPVIDWPAINREAVLSWAIR